MAAIDITRKRFGKLVVQSRSAYKDKSRCVRWDCICDCGKVRTFRGTDLRNGNITSCGCDAYENLSGQRFYRWLVIRRNGRKWSQFAYLCKCDCGTEKTVSASALRRGMSLSCGCLAAERASKQMKTMLRNGSDNGNYKHGEAKNRTFEYRVWRGMMQRCHCITSKDYPRYGGRGIAVCDAWRESYVTFLADMGRKPANKDSIDRIDNDSGYRPDNCRWATHSEQNLNRRKK